MTESIQESLHRNCFLLQELPLPRIKFYYTLIKEKRFLANENLCHNELENKKLRIRYLQSIKRSGNKATA